MVGQSRPSRQPSPKLKFFRQFQLDLPPKPKEALVGEVEEYLRKNNIEFRETKLAGRVSTRGQDKVGDIENPSELEFSANPERPGQLAHEFKHLQLRSVSHR